MPRGFRFNCTRETKSHAGKQWLVIPGWAVIINRFFFMPATGIKRGWFYFI